MGAAPETAVLEVAFAIWARFCSLIALLMPTTAARAATAAAVMSGLVVLEVRGVGEQLSFAPGRSPLSPALSARTPADPEAQAAGSLAHRSPEGPAMAVAE